MEESADISQLVEVYPFAHQVSGHNIVLRYDDNSVVKPLIPRELHFYLTIPPALKYAAPQFKGTVDVYFRKDEDGNIRCFAQPLKSAVTGARSPHGDQQDHVEELQLAATVRENGEIDSAMFQMVGTSPNSVTWDLEAAGLNPWSLRCQQLLKQGKMRKLHEGSEPKKFIVLENVASTFRLPCILDLKMGTRQHGDDVNEKKVQQKKAKADATTSTAVGLRIHGMQVYRVDTGSFLCRDKYYGRSLDEMGVRNTLCEFLHNGAHLRRDLVAPLLQQLYVLRDAVSRQNGIRFYSTSLLIIYDGSDQNCNTCTVDAQRAGVHSDCMTCINSDRMSPASGTNADKIGMHQIHGGDAIPENGHSKSLPAQYHSSNLPHKDVETLTEQKPQVVDNGFSQGNEHHVTRQSPLVDVRMIDFAHSTSRDYADDPVVYEGQDDGYLFGLNKLIEHVNDISKNSQQYPQVPFTS